MTQGSPRPVCMLTHSYYEEDARVRREAESLARAGRPVDVFALRRPGEQRQETVDGVHVIRLPVQRHQGAGIRTYLVEYMDFLARSMVAATRAHRHRRYALLQVHTLPDFLIFAGLPLRLAGRVPLVLDLHEAMPEFFCSRFGASPRSLTHRVLLAQERVSIAMASSVLTVNDTLLDRLVALGVPRDKVTVILNTPDLRLFDQAAGPVRPFMGDGTLRLVYAGALTPTYELDVVLNAIGRIVASRPDIPVHATIYGRGDADSALRARAAELAIADHVTFGGRIPLEQVPGVIAAADIGLAPTRRSPMTDLSLSTKIFEYATMGKPVVASMLPTVSRYFTPGTIAGYRPGDGRDLADVLVRLVDDPGERRSRCVATEARVRELGWDVQAATYLRVIERVARDGISSGRAALERAGPPETL